MCMYQYYWDVITFAPCTRLQYMFFMIMCRRLTMQPYKCKFVVLKVNKNLSNFFEVTQYKSMKNALNLNLNIPTRKRCLPPGGTGALAAEIARRHPSVSVKSFDFQQVTSVACRFHDSKPQNLEFVAGGKSCNCIHLKT